MAHIVSQVTAESIEKWMDDFMQRLIASGAFEAARKAEKE